MRRLVEWIRSRRVTKIDPLLELQALEIRLEETAHRQAMEGMSGVKECARCHVKPIHSYDSFGMPEHRLECPRCHSYVTYIKEWEGVKNKWNKLQKGDST